MRTKPEPYQYTANPDQNMLSFSDSWHVYLIQVWTIDSGQMYLLRVAMQCDKVQGCVCVQWSGPNSMLCDQVWFEVVSLAALNLSLLHANRIELLMCLWMKIRLFCYPILVFWLSLVISIYFCYFSISENILWFILYLYYQISISFDRNIAIICAEIVFFHSFLEFL